MSQPRDDSASVPGSDELHARLAAIVTSSDDAIVGKNLNGIVQSWNAAAERIFGYTASEMIGQSIEKIVPPERGDEEPQILAKLRCGERIDHFETVRLRKDGTRIDVSVTISPIRNPQGKIIGASKIARDITLAKQIERELRFAKEAAEQANRAKDQFLSVLSHELRTPLTPVLAAMSFLETRADVPAEYREHFAMIRRNIETEARLVDDLLDLTRISRGKIQLHFEVLDAHEALRAAVAMYQSEIDAKGLELTLGFRARDHHVWADAGRLQQVFLNLLSNAVKFTPSGGSIAVRTSEKDGQLQIDVTDSGAGIEPTLIAKLFHAFEQGEQARTSGGLGLGLAISKALVEMHGGKIVVSSAGRGQGATLTVVLSTVPANQTSEARKSPPEGALLRSRILLVEDHVDTRLVMARLLKSLGCTVTVAGTVHEALDLASREKFDLLISDIGLPDGSGIDLMQQLTTREKIRGIAISGFGQEEDLRRSQAAGFDAHLIKPINFQTLRDTVQKMR